MFGYDDRRWIPALQVSQNSIYLVNVCMHASSVCLHYSIGSCRPSVHALFIFFYDNVSNESGRVSCLCG